MLDTYRRAYLTGLAALGVLLLILALTGRMAGADIAMLLLRATHVFAAMIWIGFIWFVNVIQLTVMKAADEPARAALLTHIVPRVAAEFRRAANITALTGVLLLAALGYLTQRPPGGALWLWAGVAGGLAMVAIVHAKITPALRIVLDPSITDPARKAAAREMVRVFARCNLLLALPVTFAMIAAAHG